MFRFGRLGDMVMLTSLLQILRQRYGGACELYASGAWNAALFVGNPDVSRLWTLERHVPVTLGLRWWRAWWRLRRSEGRPIYVAEDRPRQLRRIRWLLRMAGVRRQQCVFISQVPCGEQLHWLDRLTRLGALTPAALSLALAAAEPACRTPRPRLHLFPSELAAARAWLAQQGVDAREIVLVQPGNFRTMSSHRERWRLDDDKAWPLESWVALLQRVAHARSNATLLVCGAPEEEEMIEQIVAATRHSRVFGTALPLRQFLSLCHLAHSMISIDTGPAHVAAALGVPLTVMYGAESPQKWLPRGVEGLEILAVGGPPRSKVAQLSVDEVFQRWRATIRPQIEWLKTGMKSSAR